MFTESDFRSIPEPVVMDVLERIFEWTANGGTIEDEYVKVLIDYAKTFIKEGQNE